MQSEPRVNEIIHHGGVLLWEDIHLACSHMCRVMAYNHFKPDIILGIARGGLVPATIIAHQLGINHVELFRVQSYGRGFISGPVTFHTTATEERLPFDKNILFIDDLWDSGDTMTALEAAFGRLSNPGYSRCFGTLFYKAESPEKMPPINFPGLWLPKNQWVTFPWEAK